MAKKRIIEIKTIRDWILEADNPKITQADKDEIFKIIDNNERVLNATVNNLPIAIHGGFTWTAHSRGHKYWSDVFREESEKLRIEEENFENED